MFDENDENVLEKINEKRRKKSFRASINKIKLSNFEMDEMFIEE